MADDHPTKRCPRCDTVQPASAFNRSAASKDGLSSYCKTCVRSYAAAHYRSGPDGRRGTSSGLKALARKAAVAEQKLAEARAAKRRVAAEHKALAAEVLGPALAALKAAVTALETLMGSPSVPTTKTRSANGTQAKGIPSASPPSIREISAIMAEHGVGRVEAKRIQESEIIARSEWRPSISTH